jgi:hypothetical protein
MHNKENRRAKTTSNKLNASKEQALRMWMRWFPFEANYLVMWNGNLKSTTHSETDRHPVLIKELGDSRHLRI